jgi:hypothetical protein
MVVVAFGLVSMRKRRRWTVTRSVVLSESVGAGSSYVRLVAEAAGRGMRWNVLLTDRGL